MLNKVLTWSFYILFFATPLVWASFTSELFELNKMFLVYFLTIVITTTWVIKMVLEKKLIFKKTPLSMPLLLFLGANFLSTVFSSDAHLSIYGYHSRLNGGLLSIISYTLLYFALTSNFGKEQIINFLRTILLGGFLVSLYAIPEHFGVSPSCLILTGSLNADCWVQDVEARVFATLGQPNWLGAYLAMLIFPALYFYITAKSRVQTIIYFLLSITYYLAFTFTYSRGASLGFLAGLGVFIVLQVLAFNPRGFNLKFLYTFKPIFIVLIIFLFINLLFGSALMGDFKLIKQNAPPARPAISVGTQLENGGSESGQIRLIVWKGALEIFKNNFLLGSGVETFAQTYYQYRPKEHNYTSEWDFLYNKAHNEYLNYLATTGLVGFLSYLAIILIFIVYSIWYIVYGKKEIQNTKYKILNTSLLASYMSYLIQNIFGFSVVIIAVFFYLFPGFAFLVADSIKEVNASKRLSSIRYLLYATLYRRQLYSYIFLGFIFLTAAYLIYSLNLMYRADIHFAKGSQALEQENPGRAYNELLEAVEQNPIEPVYRSYLSLSAATAASGLLGEDKKIAEELKDVALFEAELILKTYPQNVSYLRNAISTYFALSALDPKYLNQALDVVNRAIKLAPTDPKLLVNKAIVLEEIGKKKEVEEAYKFAINLKPDYAEAHFGLAYFYEKQKDKENAIKEYKEVLKIVPGHPEALQKVGELEKNNAGK